MRRYRLEWPSDGAVQGADRWTVRADAEAARREAARLLERRRSPVSWVRVVLTGPDGDEADRFVTRATVRAWPDGPALPEGVDGADLVAGPEIERLRARALAGLDAVLGWSTRRRLLTGTVAESVRIAFDAAMLGVTPPEPTAFRSRRDAR